ncbi:c-type cytochrome biogenesis protein CcmI, partial [Brucella abortus]
VRSYMILNRRNDAQDALARGMKALQGENRTELQSFATTLGLDVGTAQE